jgi:nucleotide-binding universal stress UspA family protein
MGIFKHILVPTDFTESSEQAQRLAVDMVRSSGSDFTVMHTCEVPVYAYTDMALAPIDLLSPVIELAQKELAELMRRLRSDCPGAKSVLNVGVPWQQILAVVADTGVDLIVMGTHGRRGVSHALLGSVAEKIVRMSPVPVLTVRGTSR